MYAAIIKKMIKGKSAPQGVNVPFFKTGAGKTVIVVGSIVATIIAFAIARKIYKSYIGAIEERRKASLLDTTIKGENELFDAETPAVKIHDAFFHNRDVVGIFTGSNLGSIFGQSFSEDEETAINTLNAVPDQYVPAVAKAYGLYSDSTCSAGRILKDDFNKYLNSKELARVQSKLNLIR